jgi:hypothetical protein
MDYTFLMGNVSPELLQNIYFMCKYKEVIAGKSSRYINNKGNLQITKMREVRRSHEEVMGCLSSCTREQV